MALRKVHLTNAAGRDATVELTGARKPIPPRMGIPGRRVRFKRFLGAPEQGLDWALAARFGEDYGQALIDGDPETDLELVGREIGETNQVFLSSEGEVLHAPPEIVEVIVDALGQERERRAPKDEPANVNEDLPVRWTRTKLTRLELVRRFVVQRTVQVRHVDGLTYDYLYAMAQELAEEGKVVLLGAGQKGRDPLVFYTNGSPFRAFLEGRVDGERYQLLLHLSNMELKRPAPPAAKAAADGEAAPAESPAGEAPASAPASEQRSGEPPLEGGGAEVAKSAAELAPANRVDDPAELDATPPEIALAEPAAERKEPSPKKKAPEKKAPEKKAPEKKAATKDEPDEEKPARKKAPAKKAGKAAEPEPKKAAAPESKKADEAAAKKAPARKKAAGKGDGE